MSGVVLPHGCRITHGRGAALRTPFAEMPFTMHELSSGGDRAFRGAYGFIPFTAEVRLPRHVHLGDGERGGEPPLLAERILVLDGSGLVELAGVLWLAGPGSLVDIAPGVPHSWTACPAGVRLPDGSVTQGRFLMVYQYEAATSFFPTASTAPLGSAADYRAHTGDVETIRIPAMSATTVAARCRCVWDADAAARLAVAG